MERLVIIGAAGTIGRYLRSEAKGTVIALARRPAEDVRAYDLLTDDLQDVVPDLRAGDSVVLLAALTDLNWICAHPREARALNVTATGKAIAQIASCGAHLVFLSTEQVFDGNEGGYIETDETNPGTRYGQMKVEVEQRVLEAGGCVVRAGAQVTPGLAENCVVEKTYRSLLGSRPRMAGDNEFSLTDVVELVRAVLTLAEEKTSGIYHVCAEPPVTRVDLAAHIVGSSRFGKSMNFETISYGDLTFPEPRPLRSWMKSHKARRDLGLELTVPWAAVGRKVAVLDQAEGAR